MWGVSWIPREASPGPANLALATVPVFQREGSPPEKGKNYYRQVSLHPGDCLLSPLSLAISLHGSRARGHKSIVRSFLRTQYRIDSKTC